MIQLAQTLRRRPARKWVDRNFSTGRLEKARDKLLLAKRVKKRKISQEIKANLSHYSSLFEGAENFLTENWPPNCRFIFVGQQMRPFFEAVRAINELKQSRPRSAFRYLVTPSSSHLEKIEGPGYGRLVDDFVKKLVKRKVVSPGVNHYYFIDVMYKGNTYRFVEEAIKRVNPKAVLDVSTTAIDYAGQTGQKWWEPIKLAQECPTPTAKFGWGTLAGKGIDTSIAQYVFFEAALQLYLEKRFPKELAEMRRARAERVKRRRKF